MRHEKTIGNIKAAYWLVILLANASRAIDAIKLRFLPTVCCGKKMQHSIETVFLSGLVTNFRLIT